MHIPARGRLVLLPLVSMKMLLLVQCLHPKSVDTGAATSPVPAGVPEVTTTAAVPLLDTGEEKKVLL